MIGSMKLKAGVAVFEEQGNGLKRLVHSSNPDIFGRSQDGLTPSSTVVQQG